jgi:hypothetical protein
MSEHRLDGEYPLAPIPSSTIPSLITMLHDSSRAGSMPGARAALVSGNEGHDRADSG